MAGSEPVPLLLPRDGIPPVVESARALERTVQAFAAGSGPVAVDAERASGYRYGHSAYLVQLRRAGAGTALVDPVALPDLSELATAIEDAEWVLHAALQDLPCLAELGLRPRRLFDTELAGRLAGHPRVGLGTMVETVLGFSLEKGHAAADWSRRPLPEAWLRYAALDVELLIELRDALEAELAETGKLGWAHEEFATLAAAPLPVARSDPWRRTSGIHRVRGARQLAVVREMWLARDELARRLDRSPGRVLPDRAIIEVALACSDGEADLDVQSASRDLRRNLSTWQQAAKRALVLSADALPPVAAASTGPPPARSWPERNPAAARRLAVLRTAVAAIADEHTMPSENLLAPDVVRRLAWSPPAELSGGPVGGLLRSHGAREWQIGLTATALAKALSRRRTQDALGEQDDNEPGPPD